MTEVMTTTQSEKVSKKEVRKAVYEKISVALADYKEIHSKKLENTLKKASKLLAADIAKAIRKSKKVNGQVTGQ
jgi:hypothetical protein